jgi:hypothetical protein
VAVAGTVATAASVLRSWTVTPPVGAGLDRTTQSVWRVPLPKSVPLLFHEIVGRLTVTSDDVTVAVPSVTVTLYVPGPIGALMTACRSHVFALGV